MAKNWVAIVWMYFMGLMMAVGPLVVGITMGLAVGPGWFWFLAIELYTFPMGAVMCAAAHIAIGMGEDDWESY